MRPPTSIPTQNEFAVNFYFCLNIFFRGPMTPLFETCLNTPLKHILLCRNSFKMFSRCKYCCLLLSSMSLAFSSSSDKRSKPPRNYLRLFIVRFKTHPRLLTTGQGFDIGARCDESYPHPIAILMT